MKIVPYIAIEPRIPFRMGASRTKALEAARALSGEHEMLYLADIDGIQKNKPQLDVAQKVSDELPTMYEGGIRYSNNVIDMLITGAEMAVIGTRTLVDFSELRGAFKLSENITFKVDFRDGIVSFDPEITGWAISDLLREVADIGVADVVVPLAVAEEASKAKQEHAFKLGVIAPMREKATLEKLGVDYIVTEDYGSLMKDE